MKRVSLIAALLAAAALSVSLPAKSILQPTNPAAAAAANPLQAAAQDALSENKESREAALKTLRDAGPAGLEALCLAHADLLAFRNQPADKPELQRLRTAMDKVAQQRDAIASRLYWHTDLAAAEAEAARVNKPILSLRMLGKLSDDLSCANSRFFRTTLYANAKVADYLRSNYILHWESVRPVPVITVDMGDGRKVVRTITGNSIHYILDQKGRIVDALPGLYGPDAFLTQISQSTEHARTSAQLGDAEFLRVSKRRWNDTLAGITNRWQEDLAATGGGLIVLDTAKRTGMPTANPTFIPTAAQAAPIAIGKGRIERPVLAAIQPTPASLAAATTDERWAKIAARHSAEAKLDAATQDLIALKSPELAKAAMRATFSKKFVEDPMLRMVRNLEGSIALDTVKNEYTLRPQLLEWLAAADAPLELKKFNERVYAELFLTPSSDPWLGLVPADTYAALDNEGLCLPATASR